MKIVVDSLISKLYESEILELDPNIEIIVLNPEDHTNPSWGDIPEVDALFLSYQFLFAVRDHKHLFEPMLEVAKKAKFIQSGYSGMDDPFLQAVLKETNAIVANASSIYGKPMANYVLAQMLRWNKRIDLHIELQKEKKWMPNGGDGELTNKNLLIYGYGGIGKEIARIAKSFEMNVTGIRRSPVTCEFADEVKTPEGLIDMLPFADFLVTVLPDSEYTRNVIDKKVFKQMNPQSMFINVGRGSCCK
jgi:phosphoglycerate dehydrogenase-like enzyme